MQLKRLLPCFGLLALLAGCGTTKTYRPENEARTPRADDYPIYLYQMDVEIPRSYERLGTISIGQTPFTVFGGKLEQELEALRKKARKVGGDAIRLTDIKEPSYLHSKYRMEAEIIAFNTDWPNANLSEEELRTYLADHASTLDPIEGIWAATDRLSSRIGIIRSESARGREFMVFLLENANPTWSPGDLKAELRSGERPGVYRGHFFQEDYQLQRIAFRLEGPEANAFILILSEDNPPIIFVKE